MFTGIIEAVGKIANIERQGESVRLTVAAGRIAEDVQIGDSVSINGVCLTVTSAHAPQVTFDAVYETMRKTSLGTLQIGDGVNLERSLPVNGRLGGHIVQGHVDGAGRIASIRPVGNSWFVYIDAAPELMRYIVTKGSVAIDGISLTVADSADRTFSLSIIPHTWDNTTLREKRAGDPVNIECDILGKYVEKMLGGYIAGGGEPLRGASDRGVTMDLLSRSGYVATATATETGEGEGSGGRW
ncbi:MAG: riboflavin synthase [Cytophagales bacterium]|nr:riboflavin synthase [Armatimonadota bacterium]